MTDDLDLENLERNLALWRAYVRPDADPTEIELWGAVRSACDWMPALLARARRCAELKRERDALRADFERYAIRHVTDESGAWCDMSDRVLAQISDRGCTCGLDAARRRWAKEKK